MSLPPYLTPNLRSSLIHFYSQTWSHALYLCNFASDPVDPRILGLHTPIPFPFLFFLSVLCAPLPAGCLLITCSLFLCLLAPHTFAQNVASICFCPDSVYSFPHSFLPVAVDTASSVSHHLPPWLGLSLSCFHSKCLVVLFCLCLLPPSCGQQKHKTWA